MEPLLRTMFPSDLADLIGDYADEYAVPMGKAKMACCMSINLRRSHRYCGPMTVTWSNAEIMSLAIQAAQTTEIYGVWSELVSCMLRAMLPKRQASLIVSDQERFMHTSHWHKKSKKWRCLCGSLNDKEAYFHSTSHRETKNHRRAQQIARNSVYLATHT